jgi:hypothetical protein
MPGSFWGAREASNGSLRSKQRALNLWAGRLQTQFLKLGKGVSPDTQKDSGGTTATPGDLESLPPGLGTSNETASRNESALKDYSGGVAAASGAGLAVVQVKDILRGILLVREMR